MLEQELKESIHFYTSSLLVSCRNCRGRYTLLFLCHLNSSFLGGSWWIWTLIDIGPILDVLYYFYVCGSCAKSVSQVQTNSYNFKEGFDLYILPQIREIVIASVA